VDLSRDKGDIPRFKVGFRGIRKRAENASSNVKEVIADNVDKNISSNVGWYCLVVKRSP